MIMKEKNTVNAPVFTELQLLHLS